MTAVSYMWFTPPQLRNMRFEPISKSSYEAKVLFPCGMMHGHKYEISLGIADPT